MIEIISCKSLYNPLIDITVKCVAVKTNKRWLQRKLYYAQQKNNCCTCEKDLITFISACCTPYKRGRSKLIYSIMFVFMCLRNLIS